MLYAVGAGTLEPYLGTETNEVAARFSPDGRWLAYQSDESGRYETYVRSFSGPGGKWQISTGGGKLPVWRADGKELFFVNYDHMLMGVKVGTDPNFTVDTPVPLFSINERLSPGGQFDVSSDGQRFLVNTLVKPKTSSLGVTVVTNWTQLREP